MTGRRGDGGSGRSRTVLAALAALAALVIAVFWRSASRPSRAGDRPVVLLSLDRTWWHRLGVSRFTYVRSLELAGAEARVLDYSAASSGEPDETLAERLLEGVDALVLSGGGDVDPSLYGGDPASALAVSTERDRFELALLEEAQARCLPILGICRGSQLLNVSRGGTLRTIRADPELKARHGRYRGHPVELEPGSRLARLLGTDRIERVVSYHGQAVERPGSGLAVVGRTPDGVVEAIEDDSASDGTWVVGVQWHPELSPRSALQRRLFRGLVEAVRPGG